MLERGGREGVHIGRVPHTHLLQQHTRGERAEWRAQSICKAVDTHPDVHRHDEEVVLLLGARDGRLVVTAAAQYTILAFLQDDVAQIARNRILVHRALGKRACNRLAVL